MNIDRHFKQNFCQYNERIKIIFALFNIEHMLTPFFKFKDKSTLHFTDHLPLTNEGK